jgi:uncharacterized protein YsxB (DUF464 family)
VSEHFEADPEIYSHADVICAAISDVLLSVLNGIENAQHRMIMEERVLDILFEKDGAAQ